MADILIDNWTLQRAAVNVHDTFDDYSEPDENYIRLVEAIILWDKVYYIDTDNSELWKALLYQFGYYDYLTAFSSANPEEQADFTVGGYPDGSIIRDGALRYSAFCNKNHISYLPCKERAEYLKQCDFLGSYINRKDVMNLLDRTLADYYISLNERFGTNKIKFSFPVLFDFVVANSTEKNYLETALQIRNEKEVIQFRKWLSKFEKKLQEGNLHELERLLQYIPALVDDLTKVTSPRWNAEFQLSIAPSLSIPVSGGGSAKHLIHVDFLRTLTSFAIKERKPKQQNNYVF